MIDFGIVKPGSTLYIPFATYAGSTGASVTLTGLTTGDIKIYKNGNTADRATDGYLLLDTDGIDFDALTGIHGFSINLADNTEAGFFAAGARYWVVIADVTVDSQTVRFVAATFTIGLPGAVLNTTVATLASQTSFTLTAGPAQDDALNGCILYLHGVGSAVTGGFAVVADYTGSTLTVTLPAGTTFTLAVGDNVMVMPPALVPTVLGRTLDVSATGEAGVDWANVGSPTTTLNLSATTIKTATDVETDTADIQTRLPAALVSGRMDSSTGAMAAGVLTATAVADGAIDRAALAADTGLQSIRSNTAQAGAATTITLDASASAVTDFYKNDLIVLTGGTGIGQGRYITAYNGTTKVATVTAWATNPDATTTFAVIAADAIVGATAPTAVQVADEVQTRTIAAVTTVNGLAANVITAAATAADFTTEVTAGLPTAIQNADALLARDIGSGTGAGTLDERTVRAALRFLRNYWNVSGTTLTVRKEDDSTTAWTGVVVAAPGADPVSGMNPT